MTLFDREYLEFCREYAPKLPKDVLRELHKDALRIAESLSDDSVRQQHMLEVAKVWDDEYKKRKAYK